MKTVEFVTRQKALRSRLRPYVWFWFLITIPVIYGTFLFIGIVGGLGQVHTAYYLLAVLILLPFGLLSWSLQKMMRRLQRQCGVLCPQCEGPLTGGAGQITVATGRCGHCGFRLIETDAQQVAPPNSRPPTPLPESPEG